MTQHCIPEAQKGCPCLTRYGLKIKKKSKAVSKFQNEDRKADFLVKQIESFEDKIGKAARLISQLSTLKIFERHPAKGAVT